MKIGLVGCGSMGGAMAHHLVDLGKNPFCFDQDETSRDRMSALGCETTLSARDLARQSDVVILSLPKADIVRAVMDEISDDIRKGAVVIDTSTSEPGTTRAMSARGDAAGYGFIDAPVSGGPLAARTGSMTMLIGGCDDHVASAQPVIDMLGEKIVRVGASGCGHAAKIANNMLCAANLVLVAEVMRLGKSEGVAPADLIRGINAGSGRSGVSEVNYPRWVLSESFDSGFTMGLMRKDVNLAIELARQSGVSIDGCQAIAAIWAASGDWLADQADFNEITRLER